MEENYFKKSAQVIYHYRVWRKVLWSDSGYGYVDEWKRAILLENPRDEYGRFTNDFRYKSDISVKLKDEQGKIFTATLDEIEEDVDPAMLSFDDCKKLWREIRKGSMFTCDYRNSLGVFEKTALDYYEGFLEYLVVEYGEEKANKKDTAEEFAYYCTGIEPCVPRLVA